MHYKKDSKSPVSSSAAGGRVVVSYLLIALLLLLAEALRADTPEISPEYVAASAYAKVLCSGMFVSDLREEDLVYQDLHAFPRLPVQVDDTQQSVTVTAGSVSRTALRRPGFGCVLEPRSNADPKEPTLATALRQRQEGDEHPAPLAVQTLASAQAVVEQAFVETDPSSLKNTRAVLALQAGKIIAEQYAPGVTRDTRLPGYSMTKGVTNALTGVAVARGLLELERTDLIAAWRLRENDPRRAISVEHLLRMVSGLRWAEHYGVVGSDLMTMLTAADSPADFVAAKPLARRRPPPPEGVIEVVSSWLGLGEAPQQVAPGTRWLYSGGDYELLSRVLRTAVEDSGQRYHQFPYEQLFDQLGMTSTTLETAPDNTFLLSSFMLATARDWGRFGQFLLNEYLGTSQLLPADWIRRSIEATRADRIPKQLRVGAGFWLNSLGPDVPDGAFYLGGFQGQFVVIVPELELVVVRLGNAQVEGNWIVKPIVNDVCAALSEAI